MGSIPVDLVAFAAIVLLLVAAVATDDFDDSL